MGKRISRANLADQRAEAWTHYWQTGELNSCLVAQTGEDGDIPVYDEAWRLFFGALEKGAKILDIGTGNGAVARSAFETGKRLGLDFEVHGVDAASVQPDVADTKSAGNIQFRSGVAMETLPFDDACFDCVVSQYAIEYSEIERSVDSVSRVLKAGGNARFILHSTDSVPVQGSREELDALIEIFDDMKLGRLLRKMLVVRSENPALIEHTDKRALKAIQRLEGVVESPRASRHHKGFFDLAVAHYNQRGRSSRSENLNILDKMEADYSSLRERLLQMIDAAMSSQEFEALQGLLLAKGFELVRAEQIESQGEAFGWCIDLRRKGDPLSNVGTNLTG